MHYESNKTFNISAGMFHTLKFYSISYLSDYYQTRGYSMKANTALHKIWTILKILYAYVHAHMSPHILLLNSQWRCLFCFKYSD